MKYRTKISMIIIALLTLIATTAYYLSDLSRGETVYSLSLLEQTEVRLSELEQSDEFDESLIRWAQRLAELQCRADGDSRSINRVQDSILKFSDFSELSEIQQIEYFRILFDLQLFQDEFDCSSANDEVHQSISEGRFLYLVPLDADFELSPNGIGIAKFRFMTNDVFRFDLIRLSELPRKHEVDPVIRGIDSDRRAIRISRNDRRKFQTIDIVYIFEHMVEAEIDSQSCFVADCGSGRDSCNNCGIDQNNNLFSY